MNRRRMIACAGAAALALATPPSRAQEPADAGRRHPDHTRWRPPRGDLRRPRRGHPEEHAEGEAAAGGLARLQALLGARRRTSGAASCCRSSGGWSPSRDRSPATRRSAATCGCPTRNGSRIPATRRSCSARRSTQQITSNDPIRNPYETVLERLRRELKLTPAQVATFASWDVFNAIAEHTEGATTINAGDEPLDIPGADIALLEPAADARPDRPGTTPGSTRSPFHLAMAYLAHARPRVLYLVVQRHRRLGARRPLRSAARRLRALPTGGSSSCGRGCSRSRTIAAARTC